MAVMQRIDSGGLSVRLFRAVTLDPTLYREVAEASGSSWQAVVVMCTVAAASGLAWGAYSLFYLVRQYTVGTDLGAAAIQSAVPAAWSSAVAHLLAWPVWAVGIWVVGARWTPASRPSPWFGQVARGLAFAQAPAILGLVAALLFTVVGFTLGAKGLRSGVVWVVQFWLFVVIGTWVLAGTFLAVRESLGLSNGRTLAAIVAVGLAIAVLVGLVVVTLSGISGGDAIGLRDDFEVGFTNDGPSALDIAKGLDFNLRFVGLSRTVLHVLSESVLHPFAD
jgi:hypothetical protein